MNGPSRLVPGEWIEFEDERHEILGFVGTGVRLRSESGLAQVITTAALLADATFRAAADPPKQTDPDRLDSGAVLDGLPDAERERVLDLEGHLLEATTGYRSGDPAAAQPGEPRAGYEPTRSQSDRVQAKAAELSLTARRIWQLLDEWRSNGLWALVDKRKVRPVDPVGRLDTRIAEAIRAQYAAEIHDSAGTVGKRFRRRVQNRLDATHGVGEVTLPSERTFYRVVEALLARSPSGPTATRRTKANQPDRMFGNVIAIRPGQLVMIDTTPLDVIAYDPAADTTVSVELTQAIDVTTRSLLSWRLTPKGTKGIDIGLLLADVMTPEPMRPGWREALRFSTLRVPYTRLLDLDERLAEAAARPVIYPETIMFDHGKPYQSEVMERACQWLGISIQDSRKLKATDKPQIERSFNTIRVQFSEHVAGYKGHDVAHRGRNVEEMARWSIAELEEFFAEYVVAVYQRRHHDGLILPGYPDLRLSPNEAYAMAVATTGYVTCPRDPNTYFQLLPIQWRTIQPPGVEIDYLTYNGPILHGYQGAKSPYPGKYANRWPIRHDPRNRLHAYFHHSDNTWHVLTWTHALDEHRPFTDLTLREAKKLVATRGGKPADQDEVAAALLDLQNRTDAPESWTRIDRRRQARDAERARAAARDRDRAATPVDPLAESRSPMLHVVPDLPDSEVFNLDDLEDLGTWNPHSGREGR